MNRENKEESTFTYLRKHLRVVFADKSLLLFVLLSCVITVLQLGVAVVMESLGSYTECLHRMEHVVVFLIVSSGTVLEKKRKDANYSYGYGRHEFLFVFTLNLSVIIICCFLFFEMLHGLSDGHHLQGIDVSPSILRVSDYLGYVSFVLSLISIFGFGRYKHAYRTRYSCDVYQAKSKKRFSIGTEDYVHILLDISTRCIMILSNHYGIKKGQIIADYLECGLMCCFMIYTSVPELISSAEILILGVPNDISQEIRTLTRRISMLDGVIEVKNFKYWIESPGCLIGLLSVDAHRTANLEAMVKTMQTMCSNTFQQVVIQVDQDPSLEWMDKYSVCWKKPGIWYSINLKGIDIYKRKQDILRMSEPGEISLDIFKEHVWLVAFDMDQTSLDIHTSGVAVKDGECLPQCYENSPYKPRKAKEILAHVKESIKVVIPSLLKSGIAVAICTNTDVLMAIHPSMMGGRDLVEYIFGNTFNLYPDMCDHLLIEAWRGSPEAVRVLICGKNNHLARVWERMDAEQKNYPIVDENSFQDYIRMYTGDYFESLSRIDSVTRQAMISHTLLIDDDIWNIELAKRAGYMSFKVKNTGFELEEWKDIVKAVEKRARK